MGGHTSTVKLLLEAKADADLLSIDGLSAASVRSPTGKRAGAVDALEAALKAASSRPALPDRANNMAVVTSATPLCSSKGKAQARGKRYGVEASDLIRGACGSLVISALQAADTWR